MPPGTGDIALSVVQQLPRSEIYVVTTPQDSAERVAKRMGSLAKQMKIPVRGVIENMSYLETPEGSRLTPFGAGGGQRLATALGTELLATIPLVEQLRIGADEGAPIVASDPEGATALIFAALAHRIAGLAPTRIFRKELTLS
jgi:ATP-binding protein involved in chromosome partitioning